MCVQDQWVLSLKAVFELTPVRYSSEKTTALNIIAFYELRSPYGLANFKG